MKGFLNISWFIWAGLAIVVAVIYSVIWPYKKAGKSIGFRYFIIRWGHALVWALLAINFILRGLFPAMNGFTNGVAMVGGLIYLLFIWVTFVVK